MRSSVSKNAGEGAKGQQRLIIGLKRANQTATHLYVGVYLASAQL